MSDQILKFNPKLFGFGVSTWSKLDKVCHLNIGHNKSVVKGYNFISSSLHEQLYSGVNTNSECIVRLELEIISVL